MTQQYFIDISNNKGHSVLGTKSLLKDLNNIQTLVAQLLYVKRADSGHYQDDAFTKKNMAIKAESSMLDVLRYIGGE